MCIRDRSTWGQYFYLKDSKLRMIRAFPVVLLALLSSSALLANADCFANFTERVEQKRKILWYNRYKSLDHAVYIETDTNVFNNASETKALIQSLLADGSYYMTKNKDYCAAMAPIIQSQLDSTFNYVCKADYEGFKNEWPAFSISLKDWVEFCVKSKARDPASISRIQKSPFKGSAECNKRLDEIVGNLTQIFENRKGREALRKEHENLNHAESKGCFEKAKVCVSARNGINLIYNLIEHPASPATMYWTLRQYRELVLVYGEFCLVGSNIFQIV
eukprot:TRINITY_DN11138_c0_g1_i2.p2 TRINITY_DN11138_c0_g1~~TRINITY_DN11138_c0_g1_i2.p2  ORF type:complete len:276 (-),score=72.94 TRINITY_DN11138_c0_g1_i2:153-980(-)